LDEKDQLVGLAIAVDHEGNQTFCTTAAELRKLHAKMEFLPKLSATPFQKDDGPSPNSVQ
ncbi:MAG: hypothetical protein KDA84_19075, partial [Planctomycetaceae bacterium]|nr:hypothetical protein [Planctomycetaceae bacterium]